MTRMTLAASIVGLLLSTSSIGDCRAAEPASAEKGKELFGDLIGALKASPGCLGVETAQGSNGKLLLFAWFEDKKAAMRWYYSDPHQELMKKFFPGPQRPGKPMAHVPEDGGPILTIASVTPNDKPTKENPSPFKQIAIELYQPLGDGINIGGRFAPEKMKALPPKPAGAK